MVLVPFGPLRWYRLVRYDGTDCSATLVPIRPLRWYRLTDTINKPLSERFIKLMNQLRPSKDASEHMFYNDEEIEFLAKENLALFTELHESDAWEYMLND